MSQHHLTVTNQRGESLLLVAGFDPRLREFFLSLRDVRLLSGGRREPEQVGFVDYDSAGESAPMRHIGHVEGLLAEHEIPFGEDEQNPDALNPELLSLLMVLLNEQQSGGDEVGRTLRFWDEPAAGETEGE